MKRDKKLFDKIWLEIAHADNQEEMKTFAKIQDKKALRIWHIDAKKAAERVYDLVHRERQRVSLVNWITLVIALATVTIMFIKAY
jgi:hypothetical protein